MNCKALMHVKKLAGAIGLLLFAFFTTTAQTRTLSLNEAVQLGVQNSKQLKRSQYKINEALARLDQSKDAYLPSATVGFQYLHALMMTRTVNIPGLTDAGKPLKLPFDFPAYLGTLAVSEPIFKGNQLKYARQSADLMVQLSRLDADKDKEDITYLIISSYINYNKILQNQQIVTQNMQDVQSKLDEIVKYEGQGLATQNDVLRFRLQKSQIQLTQIELENNRRIANFNMNIMLGLPDSTTIQLPEPSYRLDEHPVFADFLQQAEANRRELQELGYQDKLAGINIKKIQDQRLPTVSANVGAYYINPTGKPIPTGHTVLAPVTLGVGASWDIATLYTNKNKVREATIQKQSLSNDREDAMDQIKKDVNQYYIGYLQALERIKVLQDAVTQAAENERIMESKFRNNLATTTDRIDAQTLIYQSRVNLELAKSDATIAYYDLLRSTGHIQP
ncbi:MAG TPA: TolC family protein [Puia sp.]|nr:TolC family protein [Puia sp.]